jgi:hypothetical protein
MYGFLITGLWKTSPFPVKVKYVCVNLVLENSFMVKLWKRGLEDRWQSCWKIQECCKVQKYVGKLWLECGEEGQKR